MKYFFRIFGCAMNYADSERVASVLNSLGWKQTKNLEEANLVLLFTCSVRQKSEDKVFGELVNFGKWKAKKRGRKIGLSGCMVRKTSSRESDKKDAMLRRSEILDFVWRIEDSQKLGEFLSPKNAMNRVSIKPKPYPLNPKTSSQSKIAYLSIHPTRANKSSIFIPIMSGCDNFCSYCVVPFARGREVSRNSKEIIEECKEAIKQGVLEITLLGQNVNSYQKKKGEFAKLLEKIAKLPKLKRLRFTSSHPKDFDASVIEVMRKYPNIEKHLHLPAQHGDDAILKKMNRNYTSKHYLKLIEKFREKNPHSSITTDIIVGFPSESKQNFENLLKFYREANFDFAYFAKYSPRKETRAYEMGDDVSLVEKKKRFKILNALVVELTSKKYAKLKNKTLEVLVEKCVKGVCEGRSSEFYLVKFEGKANLVGKLVKVKITKPREVELWGEKV